MSKCYFAKLNESNDVIEVVVVAGDIPTAAGPLIDNPKHVDGETWCQNNISPGTWKQCSDDGSFRNKFPGEIYYYYDSENDRFLLKKPYDNWVLNSTNLEWEPPITNKPTISSYTEISGKNLFPATWNPDTQRLEAKNNLDLTEDTVYYWDDTSNTFTS